MTVEQPADLYLCDTLPVVVPAAVAMDAVPIVEDVDEAEEEVLFFDLHAVTVITLTSSRTMYFFIEGVLNQSTHAYFIP
jgi:hypothetical protein